ncbi:MAG: S41 family peptidase [Bacteroidetes bacterium]|jgi:carboxyl-terminal processing protease|nr:S41 family peptidase [Bacteroidota bacterium]MBT6685270.1 S41 family peptidase [Bacteroidota bacterium]MBT7141717.1 S41 family peptidase [Bacteroidota bacterium]MBT7491415.1 S41 family peptidase [Bacteroidota bacterium]
MRLKEIYKSTKIRIATIVLVLSGFVLVSFDNDDFEIVKNLDIYYTLFRELNLIYVDETDAGKLVKTSIDQMLKSLDPYTVYIPESKLEDYKFMTTGQYGGIGALIRNSGDFTLIAEPYEDSPAMKAGLKAGDIIIEVDKKSIKGKDSDEISEVLKGQPNTPVDLLIERPGEENKFTKTLIREEIKIKSVPYFDMLNEEIGYISLSQFTMNCSNDVKEALIDLKENRNAKSIILDLRSNPGGLLMEAVKIANLFVEKDQEIVSTKGKVKQWNKTYKSTMPAYDSEIPIIVLVNSGSASASEIVSGAIQDLDRGVIVGQRTFGKGLVQATRDLSYNSKLKVTTAKYYIPSGRCIQALDYSNRNDDGSVGKIADSIITQFSTKNGRKVYDGGGIMPDIITEPKTISNISISLVLKNHIFDFATQYCLKHDSIVSAKDFVFADKDYEDFKNYISDKDFDYESNSEYNFNKLKKIAEQEKYFDMAKEEFDALYEKIRHDKNKDLQIFKDELIEILSEEIVSRYYYQKGRIQKSFEYDNDIKKAISLLGDNDEYNKILK